MFIWIWIISFIIIICVGIYKSFYLQQNKENKVERFVSPLQCFEKCQDERIYIQELLDYSPHKENTSNTQIKLVGHKAYTDTESLYMLRKRIRDFLFDILKNQKDFVILFDKINFMGKMYIIPCHQTENIIWKSPYFTDRNVNETETEIETGRKKHLDVDTFMKNFGLSHGMHFSAIVPVSSYIEIIPLERENEDRDDRMTEPMIINPGVHAHLKYFRTQVKEFHIMTQTNKKNQ